MAQPPSKASDNRPGSPNANAGPAAQRSPRSPSRLHGRGGLGNINNNAAPRVPPTADELRTPTIKTPTYTTGRGGKGNMRAMNPARPEEAREAQDVEVSAAAAEKTLQGTYHWGRGGEGNATTVRAKAEAQNGEGAGEKRGESRASRGRSRSVEAGDEPGAAEKAAEGEEKTAVGRTTGEDKRERKGSFQNALDKGREMLRRKKAAAGAGNADENAIED